MTEPDQWGTPEGQAMIELLWDPPPPPRRGPRQRLTLGQVVDAGMAVAARSVDELSMRKVAQELGVGTMSLYTYVPGRDELFELMVDRAWGMRKFPERDLPWRAQAEFHAHEAWRMYREHPWLISSNLWRMPLGPHVLDVQEDLYRAVLLTGLDAVTVVRSAGLVESHVFGAARAKITDTSVAARTGVTQDDYYAARAGFWGTYFSEERFPSMLTLWNAGGFDAENPDGDWEFGLALILDGIERLADGVRG
ncbi:TetR/AcrR family transcriptional regulator C-terminal domain-containing protein [Pseudonocardia sp. NPDC049635]|uniref:TetR/AcrR family transcriptional regulator n=1 Tax=Pseudonocardia sp. NPDC049635 TaxID=3155506 RepID=UPI0033F7CB93